MVILFNVNILYYELQLLKGNKKWHMFVSLTKMFSK